MPKQVKEKAMRHKPPVQTPEDTSLYKKLLMGFAVGQLILAGVYYIVAAVVSTFYIVLLAVTVVCMFLVGKVWDKKGVRILGRSLLGLLAVAAVAWPIVYVCVLVAYLGFDWYWLSVEGSMAVSIFMQTVLLCLMPAYVMAASQDRKMDVVLLRIVSVATFACALILVLYAVPAGTVVVGIDNMYFGLFYLLCTAVTAVLSFVIQPITMPKWLRRMRERKTKIGQPDASDAQREKALPEPEQPEAQTSEMAAE